MCRSLLTIDQAAALLGVSRSSLYELITTGHVPTVNVSAGDRPRYRIRPDDLDTFVNSRLTERTTTR